ncbi:MAG: hypothetical protein PWP46_1783 [Fusobacteriaceae bacterium]|jgi:predicted NBD/HSP70 family sugar kinase/DNA-binding XRE family transcriptional regulator|nr:hypothetical protein [Fusobacteriaceae bacterium]
MKKKGLNQNDIKIRNRSKILKILRNESEISRKDLADKLELTKAAISSLISELINEKIIIEQGIKDTGVSGRKKIILELNSDYAYALGLSISETHINLVVSNILGEKKDEFFYEFTNMKNINNEDILKLIIEKSLYLLWKNNIEKIKVIGFGITCVGELSIVDIEYIKENLEKNLEIKVIADNNVKALAIAQMDFGYIKLSNDFLFVKYGPGLGMAIIQNGVIVNGATHQAGEIGYTIADINANTYCRCGRKGCLESLISEKGIVEDIMKLNGNYSDIIINKNLSILNYNKINSLLENNDENIKKIFEYRYEYLAKSLANTIILLNPEYLCVFGSVFSQPYIMNMIHEKINRYLGTHLDVELILSDIKPENTTIGAVALVLRNYFYNKGGYIE